MAKILNTVFQGLDKAITGDWGDDVNQRHVNSYDISTAEGEKILYKTTDKQDYERQKLELQQNSWLNDRWVKANVDLSVQAFAGLNNVKLMYRDADLMDSFPEIGAALDIVSEESCINNDKGQVINVTSKSDRIRAILEDLFVNRLDIQVTAQMIVRGMCKYGNMFMMLNLDHKNGVLGWRQLPVFNVERLENGIENPYGAQGYRLVQDIDKKTDLTTKFIWTDETSEQIPFRNWQIAHFRLITNSLYLPYGVSYLNAARRHWRMLSLMEDMMLIYRLERSIERRIYKIYVGAIDDADVQAYVQQIANNFKRTPIIDPMTGQIDLRKNIMSVDQDIFIPVRDPSAPTPIETLAAAQNLTALDDIKFVQNKVLTALRIPRTFLNFDESQGNGQNLALEDVRFTRTINRIQQAFLMELTKVASIHLYLLGFDDDLTNFSLSMNNPSTQAEQLEIENVSKKIGAVQTAVADPGNGIPIMSLQRALKQVMKWSDKEIQDNFEEIRLEKAIANELQMTNQIIKRTGIFDNVDRIYGEPGAQYQENQNQGGEGDMQGMGGGGMPPMGGGGGDFGSGLDELGSPNDDGMGEIGGESGEMPAADASNMLGGDEGSTPPEGNPPPMEAVSKNKPLLIEKIERKRRNDSPRNRTIVSRPDILDKTLLINEEFNNMISSLDEYLDNEKK